MTKSINFDELINRHNSNSVKWDRYREKDILPLWVADTDFRVAPEIIEAMRDRVEHGLFGYTHAPETLYEVIVERLLRLYAWEIKPQWIVYLTGVVSGLNIASRCIGTTHDAVLTPAVIYPPFAEAAALSNRQSHQIPMMRSNRRWIIDLDYLEYEVDDRARVLLFCNPQNPGGAVYTEDELTRLATIIENKNLLVCSDEVHCDLILDQEKHHIPVAALNRSIANRSITLMAPSKTFNLAGLGFAFAIIPDQKLRRQFRNTSEGIVSYPNLLGYVAAETAYKYADSWKQQQVDYLRSNRDYLIDAVNKMRGLRLDPIESTYLAWIDVSELGLDNPAEFFEQAGVGLSSGKEFGDDRFMRLNFGCPRSMLEEAVKRMNKKINTYWNP